MQPFYKRHFLRLMDFTPAEIAHLLALSTKLKADKKTGQKPDVCKAKTSHSSSKKIRLVLAALSKLLHTIRARK